MIEAKQLAKDLITQYGDDAEAIAMLKSAEYAANLDQETEALIAKTLKKLKGSVTTIIVSHGEGIIKHVDQVVKFS